MIKGYVHNLIKSKYVNAVWCKAIGLVIRLNGRTWDIVQNTVSNLNPYLLTEVSINFILVEIGAWCNGNTTVFGAVVPGSNPGAPTNLLFGVMV